MIDTSIWEARADRGQAATQQPHQWPSLLVLSLIWVPAHFLLPPTCLASHDLWDTQICSHFGIACSLGRPQNLLLLSGPWAPLGLSTSTPDSPVSNRVFALELPPFSPTLSQV